ncbi:MAG: hypothetical protein AAFR73_06630 [Pseudomonadota bacterium]
MPGGLRIRFIVSVLFLAAVGAVLYVSPIAGIVLFTLPILWTVFVIWTGSEAGVSFGPYSRTRETVFSYTLRYLWNASTLVRIAVSVLLSAVFIGGLVWMSTENMRAKAVEPSITERAKTAAVSATEVSKEVAVGWFATAKGWFSSEAEE